MDDSMGDELHFGFYSSIQLKQISRQLAEVLAPLRSTAVRRIALQMLSHQDERLIKSTRRAAQKAAKWRH